MRSFSYRPGVTVSIASLCAIVVALVAALGVVLTPAAWLGVATVDSGLAALLPVTAPPLGVTARLGLMLLAASVGGGVAGLTGYALLGRRVVRIGTPRREHDAEAAPTLRRADAHPDAPARRPLFAARDLGEPTPPPASAPAPAFERALPNDLDAALADYAPADWTPAPPPKFAPRPLRLAPGERLDTFALRKPSPPKIAPEPAPAAEPTVESAPIPNDVSADLPSATIHDLLSRLECGIAQRSTLPPMRADRLEETLGALRRLAAQG